MNRAHLRFQVDSRLATLLSQEYPSSERALKELLDNAWDADAERVSITLPKPLSGDPIVIQDDGSGMTEEELRRHYLSIATDRRSRRGERTAGKNRLVKGRKGIGKFSGLMAAATMKVETYARSRLCRFTLRLEDLSKVEDIEQLDIGLHSEACDPEAYNLVPGIALSAAQMAQLTNDIVWLVEKDITLANGTTTKALVPQLYVHVQEGDLQAGGALMAGNNVNLNVTGNLLNGGTIAGRQVVALTADNINNLGGRILGADVGVAARTDLNNIGGTIAANNSLVASAGRDLNVASTTRTQTNAQGSQTNIERVAGLYVTGSTGTLLASAGRDANLIAAAIQNQSSGDTSLTANNNVNLGTVTQSSSNRIVWNGNNNRSDSSKVDIGTNVQTQGNLTLAAGNDLNAKAANVTSNQGGLLATAGNNVNLTAGEANVQVDEAHQHKGRSSAFSSKTITTRDTLDQTTAQATTLSGKTATVLADQNINLTGSNVVSDNGTTLVAQNNLNVAAAINTTVEGHFKDEKKSGIFSGGGIGITIGTQQQSTDQKGVTKTAAASMVGSTQGDINLHAGKNYAQTGSDVIATQGNVNIGAQKVDINEARETSNNQIESKFKQSGLTVAITASEIDIAEKQLAQQALKDVDYLWRAQLSDGNDKSAEAFLASNKQTFTNDLGEQQKLFTATGQQLFRPEMFADTADPAFYKQFAQSGISRPLSTGLIKELKDSGIELKNGAVDLTKAAIDNPGLVFGALLNVVKGLPGAVKDSFVETGHAIGEGSAVAFNDDINKKLNAIYGNDVSGYQAAMLAIRTMSAVAGAAGTAKVVTATSEKITSAISKKLEDIAAAKAAEQAIADAKVNNNFYRDGLPYDVRRVAYKSRAKQLVSEAEALLAQGKSEEQVARWANAQRDQLKIEFREISPQT